jgi:hypothetical protein
MELDELRPLGHTHYTVPLSLLVTCLTDTKGEVQSLNKIISTVPYSTKQPNEALKTQLFGHKHLQPHLWGRTWHILLREYPRGSELLRVLAAKEVSIQQV